MLFDALKTGIGYQSMDLKRFAELEKKVKELIEKYNTLKEEHESVKKELAKEKEHSATLEEELHTDKEKRIEALDRVDELIKLLESVPN